MEASLVIISWSDMIVNLLLWSAQRSFWAAQISVCQCVARLWKETSTACLQLCLIWTLVVLCYSARPCYDIVPCCCASEMNIVSNIWSLFSCACLTFNMCCTFWAEREGLFDPMIDLDYAQPMWPSVARLLDDSFKVLQFCTSRPIHLNWIVELLAKPSLRTYLIADSVEVCCSPRPTCLMNVWGCFRA